jgi:hypothetical protein
VIHLIVRTPAECRSASVSVNGKGRQAMVRGVKGERMTEGLDIANAGAQCAVRFGNRVCIPSVAERLR